ncbi:MAG: hypothetical protein H6Q75_742 [Firmicutes bacterium]|nr:hypothetical protein [Bacillota bacterium]
MVIHMLERIGRSVIVMLENGGRVIKLFLDTVGHLRRKPNGHHVLQQMVHLGVNSLPIVMLTMLFTGMVLTIQTAHEFIRYGAQSSVGGIVFIAMGRELAPVLTGVVVAGRVGAAITAEIGSMKVTEQIDALKVMATDPVAYLVVPRLLSCMFMLPVLGIFAIVIGTVGGYLVASTYSGISSFSYFHSIKTYAVVMDVLGGLIKTIFFGAIVAIIGCHKGLTTAQGAEGVGRATTGSVVASMILIFISNYFLSVLLYR